MHTHKIHYGDPLARGKVDFLNTTFQNAVHGMAKHLEGARRERAWMGPRTSGGETIWNTPYFYLSPLPLLEDHYTTPTLLDGWLGAQATKGTSGDNNWSVTPHIQAVLGSPSLKLGGELSM